MVWCTLKLIRGVLGAFSSKLVFAYVSIDTEDTVSIFILGIVYCFVFVFCDACPVLLMLNGSFIKVFIVDLET